MQALTENEDAIADVDVVSSSLALFRYVCNCGVLLGRSSSRVFVPARRLVAAAVANRSDTISATCCCLSVPSLSFDSAIAAHNEDVTIELYPHGLDSFIQNALALHASVSSVIDACRAVLRIVGGLSNGEEELDALEVAIADMTEEGTAVSGTLSVGIGLSFSPRNAALVQRCFLGGARALSCASDCVMKRARLLGCVFSPLPLTWDVWVAAPVKSCR